MKLITIAPGRQLEELAAYSYMRCLIAGIPEGVTSAYRTPEQQQALVDRYNAGTGNYALPPSESEHVKGRALDLPWGAGAREWMRAHGAEHGWFPVTNEKHHFNYLPNLDTHQGEDMFTDRDRAKLDKISGQLATVNWNVRKTPERILADVKEVLTTKGVSGATADEIVDELTKRLEA